MFDLRSITVDCADPYRQAVFWGKVTGWQEDPDGTGWVTMADPEGNEFCVERSGAERGEI